MGIIVGDNFNYQASKPLDSRAQFASLADMKAYPDASLYDGCIAYVTANKKNYQYDSNNTTDTNTGKWREFTTGGGGTSNYNDLTNKPQIAGTTLTGNTSLATLGLTSSVETQSDGSSTKSYVNRGEKYNWNTGSTWYGTCTTSASTTAKSVTLARGTLNFTAGAKIAVKFSYTNTASAPTLTVNSTTKNIKYIDADGNVSTPLIWWNAGDVVEFTYDGTQWLMQPTMQMLFSGQGTKIPREQIYSTTEKVVGCWTDGRPVYQKTINFGTLPNTTTKAVNHSISNFGVLVSAKGTFWNSTKSSGAIPFAWPASLPGSGDNNVSCSVTTTQIIIAAGSDMSSYTNCYVTLQYTKTTDSANSFNYGDPNDYSTTEKIVGSWIDGKALYQKTISYTCPTCSTEGEDAQTSLTSSMLIGTNVNVKRFDSVIVQSNGNVHMLPIVNSATATISNAVKVVGTKVFATKSGTSVYLACINNRSTSNGCTISTTVQYTKS